MDARERCLVATLILGVAFFLKLVSQGGVQGGFPPFVNMDGNRVVRWHRLVLAWIIVTLAYVLGALAASYGLKGDWSHFILGGLALGVASSVWTTILGFHTPIEKLPSEIDKCAAETKALLDVSETTITIERARSDPLGFPSSVVLVDGKEVGRLH